MVDLQDKLSYLSFSQQSEDKAFLLVNVLRKTKKEYAECASECYNSAPIILSDWKNQRNSCVSVCGTTHNKIFFPMQKLTKDIENTKKCVLRCGFDTVESRSGKEDKNVCEEICYEGLYSSVSSGLQDTENLFELAYYEKPNLK